MTKRGTSDEYEAPADEYTYEEQAEETAGAGGDFDSPEDLTQVETPKPVPRAWYPVSIVSSVPGMSKGDPAKGGPQKKISIRVKIEGGQYDGRNVFEDRKSVV